MPGKSYWVQPLSYVISVSLGKGCYRHIRISADMTFDDLSCAILDAFMFDNDHLHGFFMDNIFWSRNEDTCIWADDMDGEAIHVSDEVTLREWKLSEGQAFKYLFDFGDEWRFSCKVLRAMPELTESPQVIRSKGDAPEQYPDWDEDDEYEDEDEDEDPDGEE